MSYKFSHNIIEATHKDLSPTPTYTKTASSGALSKAFSITGSALKVE